LIDGEKRIVGYYDEAIYAAQSGSDEEAILVGQRQVLLEKIADMQRRKDMAA
jgi:hypothetical protein